MTRGNQRDLARAKNAKKQSTVPASQKAGNVGVSTDKRMERDAAAMREKQEKALEKKKAEQEQANSKPKVVKIDPLKA
uniref:Small EDRK-rich factor-like N-terminal domain-containing protein n=1 Tax=Ditylenchus dipsaci TaxID=166011 RepID=A0A915EIR3_9BILA